MKTNKRIKIDFSESRYLAVDGDPIAHNIENDGVDRRGFLKCMAWAGTGALWTMSGGLASSVSLGEAAARPAAAQGFTFLQISDSHVGFAKPANPDAKAT